MTRQMNATCEMGFWKPETNGCPVCGPDGPCTIDPEALARDQAKSHRAMEWRSVRIIVVAALAVLLVLILTGCSAIQRPEPILVPVPTNCVTGQIPQEPRRIQGELTGNSGLDIGIIAGSAIELRAWGVALYGMLVACQSSGPAPTPPAPAPQP